MSSIERCPHDKQNPYAQISRKMLRDKNLSFKARGLLACLLSYRDDWKFHARQLAEDNNVSLDMIYSGLNELIEAGYCERVQSKDEKNKFGQVKYSFSEFKKCFPQEENTCAAEENEELKKCLPQKGFPDAGGMTCGLNNVYIDNKKNDNEGKGKESSSFFLDKIEGLTAAQKSNILETESLERIQAVVEYTLKSTPENPPAFLLSALRNNWKIPETNVVNLMPEIQAFIEKHNLKGFDFYKNHLIFPDRRECEIINKTQIMNELNRYLSKISS